MTVAPAPPAHRGRPRRGPGRSLRARRHAPERLHRRDLSGQRRDRRRAHRLRRPARRHGRAAHDDARRRRPRSSCPATSIRTSTPPTWSRRPAWPATCCRSGPRPSSPTRCSSGSWAGCARSETVADALARSPLKFYWMIRVHAQARTTDEATRYPPARHRARADAPVDRRRRRGDALAGRVGRQPRPARAGSTWRCARGQRVEGHTAGAAADKIAAIAAGGLTLRPRADHRPRGAGPRAAGHRRDAARVVAPSRPRRPARRAQGRRRRSPRDSC